jgi:hypothetical protein
MSLLMGRQESRVMAAYPVVSLRIEEWSKPPLTEHTLAATT